MREPRQLRAKCRGKESHAGRVVRPGSVLPSVCLTNTHPHPCVSGPNGFNMRDPTVRLVVFVAMTASGDGELDTWAAQADLV